MPLWKFGDFCWFWVEIHSVKQIGEARWKAQGYHNSPCDKTDCKKQRYIPWTNPSIVFLCANYAHCVLLYDSLCQVHEVDDWAYTVQPRRFPPPLCQSAHVMVDCMSQLLPERVLALSKPGYSCCTGETQSFGKIHRFHHGLQSATCTDYKYSELTEYWIELKLQQESYVKFPKSTQLQIIKAK